MELELLIALFVIAFLCSVLFLFLFFDVFYFIRAIFTVAIAKFFKSKCHILDEISVRAFCLTNDIDTLIFHMNNARYLREADFGRLDFYERTGLYRAIRAKGGSLAQGACTIRYRKFIKPYTSFKLTSKIIYWDSDSIYMEHKYITKDNFIRAISIDRQRIIKASAEEVMNALLMKNLPNDSTVELGKLKPPMPSDLEKWIESNKISSANLRGAQTNGKIDDKLNGMVEIPLDTVY